MTTMEQTYNDLSPPSPDKLISEPDHDVDEEIGDVGSASGSPKRGKKKRDNSALRKAPQAPKRFKSSYICFFMAKQPDIKEELGDKATVTEISKRSAERWRNLPAEERAHWDEVAAKDKQRYMMEKASYTGPWQVPWKRAKKDPSAPKRPMSAFLYFSQGRRKKIKDDNNEMKNTEVSRLLGEMWRNATEAERKPYVEEEKQEREKYKVAIAAWKKDFEQKKEDERKLQAQQQAQWSQQYGPDGPDSVPPPRSPPSYPTSEPYMPPHPPSHFGHYPPPPSHGYYAPYPPPGPYQYPTNGKQPVILGPNGMPHYPSMPPPHPPQSGQMYGPPPTTYDDGHPQMSSSPPAYEYVPEQISEPEVA